MPSSADYELVIIGAGIQGAGIAQAAAVCGYKTLLIEKFPAAGLGTSSKSSKLIHGGLRYLESGQFKLVRECLRERKILLRNAPQLVKLIPFHIPVYSHSKRSPWIIRLGLMIYSLFSMKTFSSISKSQWSTLDNIEQKNLKCVFKYYDAQTNDKQLTRAVIESARKYGARIEYNAEFLHSKAENKLHKLTYRQHDQIHEISCHCIINCSGPWIESTQEKIIPALQLPDIERVAGSHIVIEQTLEQGAYYIEAEDGRAVFVMPWQEHYTLIGTTERVFKDKPDHVSATENEINYLLNTYNTYFRKKIKPEQIIESFAGLRVLPSDQQSVFNRSRESMIICKPQPPALISIVGGKLTSYRATSEEVIGRLKKILPATRPAAECNTENIPLSLTD